MNKSKEKEYFKGTMAVVVISILMAAVGALLLGEGDTFEIGIVFEIMAGLGINFLISKEFEFIAFEKGYNGKRYFWYAFFMGFVGYLLVIALPNKSMSINDYDDELPEL